MERNVIQLTGDEAQRYEGLFRYKDTLSGKLYPSPSNILSCIVPAKRLEWHKTQSAAAQAKVLQVSAAEGTERHELARQYFSGTVVTVPAHLVTWFDHLKRCVDKHKIRPYYTEKVVYSDDFHFAGTTDLVAEFTSCGEKECCGTCPKEMYQNRMSILDLKTGRYGGSATTQMAGYLIAAQECLNLRADSPLGIVGLAIHRDERGAKCVVTEHPEWKIKSFVGALESVYKDQNFYPLHKMEWEGLFDNALVKYYERFIQERPMPEDFEAKEVRRA